MGAVADQRRAFFFQGGDDQFPQFAVGEDFAGFGIDDLKIEVIIEIVHPCVVLAVDGDAGAVYFGESVDIVKLHAEFVGDAVSHLFAPAFGTDHTFFQADLVFYTALFDLFGQEQSVGRGGAENGGLHIFHETDLFIGVAGAHGHGHGAQLFRAQLEADAGGPEAVAGSDLNAVFIGDAGDFVTASEQLRPVVHILLGVRDDHRCAGGAAGRMDTDDLFFGHGGETQGIRVAEIGFFREGEFFKIRLCFNGVDVDAL